MLEQFAKENPLITVTPIYQGSYSDIHTKLMSAVTAENVPALCVANTSYPAMYGAQGICTDLTPTIRLPPTPKALKCQRPLTTWKSS